MAYVYEGFGCSERSKPQSGAWSTSEHLGAPKSPKSHFFIRVRRLRVVWEPQMHFWRFWALRICHAPHWAPRAPAGARPLTDPTPYRSLTEGEGGGFHSSPSQTLPLRVSTAPQQTSYLGIAVVPKQAFQNKRSALISKRHGETRPARRPSVCPALLRCGRGPPGTM